jgi:hypothetical protein
MADPTKCAECKFYRPIGFDVHGQEFGNCIRHPPVRADEVDRFPQTHAAHEPCGDVAKP